MDTDSGRIFDGYSDVSDDECDSVDTEDELRTVLSLYYHCTITVLSLYCHCTVTVLSLYYQCWMMRGLIFARRKRCLGIRQQSKFDWNRSSSDKCVSK